ncbi:hypothetical protein C0J52_10627 [Blattella germanica]|nr:hypothetical protein C0J52_10627 [Blattella germanica]
MLVMHIIAFVLFLSPFCSKSRNGKHLDTTTESSVRVKARRRKICYSGTTPCSSYVEYGSAWA